MSDPIKKLTHGLRSQLSVVKNFIDAANTLDLPEDLDELREAAARNVDKMKALIESAEEEKGGEEIR